MKIFYSDSYNIDIGVFNLLHPFDGGKFRRVYNSIKDLDSVDLESPPAPISDMEIDGFVDSLLRLLIKKKRYILRALEVPYVPLIPYSLIDKRVLLPMRWSVAGTLEAARSALAQGVNSWNLSGGYHHASRGSCEGFCVYNDIGISVDILKRDGLLASSSKILIVDIDAHHGNGNAHVFMEDANVTIVDIYNDAIYPGSPYTKERVNINIPLANGTNGDLYLRKLSDGLSKLDGGFDIAFVVAGTDVLASDPLGGLGLSGEQCAERDVMVADKLAGLSTPCVFVGGGGYSKGSAEAITESLTRLYGR